MSTFSPALQLAHTSTSTVTPSHLSVITPVAPHLSLLMPTAAPARDRAVRSAAAPAQPEDSTIVVERFLTGAEHGTCALCWSGPESMAGSVHRLSDVAEHRLICGRCLVTLEMLAAQFDSELQLHIETSA